MKYVALAAFAALAIFCGFLKLDNARLRHAVMAEVSAHKSTKDTYRAAQADADKLEAERLLKANQNGERITDEYQARLADLRARAERLHQASLTRKDTAGGPDSVPVSDAATGVAEACPHQGLSIGRALIASEQAEQLDSLLEFFQQPAFVPAE
jgi:hypothetical protein